MKHFDAKGISAYGLLFFIGAFGKYLADERIAAIIEEDDAAVDAEIGCFVEIEVSLQTSIEFLLLVVLIDFWRGVTNIYAIAVFFEMSADLVGGLTRIVEKRDQQDLEDFVCHAVFGGYRPAPA